MKPDEKSFGWGVAGRRAAALLLLLIWFSASAADLRLPELKTRSGTYSNVLVTSRTQNDIMISHDRGLANVKLSDIEDDAALLALGYNKPASKEKKTIPDQFSAALSIFTGTNQPLKEFMKTPAGERLEDLRAVRLSSEMKIGIAAGAVVLYLFGCFCMKLICVKAGYQPGVLIWLPVFQMIPMFRAAGMSGWWLLACFIPLLNLIAMILWSFKIARARGKGALVAIALLLPLLNLFAVLYLAFSGVPEPEERFAVRR